MQNQENSSHSIISSPSIFNFNAWSSHRSAQLVLFLANIIWGITPLFIEISLGYFTPLQTTTLRFGVAVLVFSVIIALMKGRSGFSMLSGKTVITLGWLDALAYITVTVGQDITTPGLALLVSSFYIFFVPFLAWKIEGTELSGRVIVIGIVGLGGIFLISFNGDWTSFSNSSIIGIIILMLAAFMWGFYTVITGKFLNKAKSEREEIDLMSLTYASLFHTFLALLILSMMTGDVSFHFHLELLPYILFLGIFPTIIALGSWNWAMARLGSINTSFLQLFQIIIPFILELIFLQQFYSIWTYTGIFLVFLSIIWIDKGKNYGMEKKQQIEIKMGEIYRVKEKMI
ncbi:MAG: DMT family transporter [Candidatus Heimdallarchaeota archaeon]